MKPQARRESHQPENRNGDVCLMKRLARYSIGLGIGLFLVIIILAPRVAAQEQLKPAANRWAANMEKSENALKEGRVGDAAAATAAALLFAQAFGQADPRLARTLFQSAEVKMFERKYADAEAFYRSAIEVQTRATGPSGAE